MKLFKILRQHIQIPSLKNLLILCWVHGMGTTVFAQFGSQHIIDSEIFGITKIVTADLNNDGYQDIITAQKYHNNNKISCFMNLGDGSFGPQIILSTNVISSEGVAVGDLNGDGWIDVVAISHQQNSVLWFPNSEGSFPTEIILDTGIISPEDVEVVDIDNDGKPDIVVLGHINIVVFYNFGDGTFSKIITPNDMSEYYSFSIADLDGDGLQDIIIGSGEVLVYMNNNGSFTTHDVERSNSIDNLGFCFMIRTADLDGNGTQDIILDGQSNSIINWYSNNGNGYFTTMQTIEFTNQCQSLATADFDANGSIDVIAALNQEGEVAVYFNNNGKFESKQVICSGIPATTNATAIADLNNDGSPDIIWAHPFSFHLNDGLQEISEPKDSKPAISFSPNPFLEYLVIHAPETSILNVFDTFGRPFYRDLPLNPGNNTFTHPLDPQIYLFQIISANKVSTNKIIKK